MSSHSPPRSVPPTPTSPRVTPQPPPNPLKRKTPPDEDDGDERSFTPPVDGPKGEYETGRVICEVCGGGVSFRDQATGGFTLKHWNDHRESCVAPSPTATSGSHPASYSPEIPTDALLITNSHSHAHPPAKRRRAKRTEEERIEYLRADPYVAQFEAYRVLCASCDKWIRLRPNSTYCSIPWDAHRKSCLAKKINSKNVYALEERNTLFSKDPDVRKFDAERVLCNMCDQWLALNPDDHLHAVQTWLQHRSTCQKAASNLRASLRPTGHSPTSDPTNASAGPSQPPPAGSPPILSLSLSHPHTSLSTTTPSLRSPSFHDLNPANYAPAHESRRRNAEQRAATLRADTLIGSVEPNRVFCSLCQKWVQLRQDSSYCAYPWLQHRGKCLARHQRRAQKAAEVAEAKARKFGGVAVSASASTSASASASASGHPHTAPMSVSDDDDDDEEDGDGQRKDEDDADDDAESEEGVESGDGVERVRQRERERVVKREVPEREHGYHHHHQRREQQPHHRPQQQGRPVNSHGHGHAPSSSSSSRTHGHHHHQQQHPYHHYHQKSGPGAYPRPSSAHSHPHAHAHAHAHRPPSSRAPPPSAAPPPPQGRVIRTWNAEEDADAGRDAGADGGRGGGEEEEDAEGSYVDGDNDEEQEGRQRRVAVRRPPRPVGLADLDSVAGRRHFIHASITHLFNTTYERDTDELRVAGLLTYVNAAAPPDKHEDFDTGEVVRALGVLKERGRVRMDGDVVRLVGGGG